MDWQSDSVLVDETESMRGQDEPVNFAGGTQSTEFSNGGTGYLESREPNGRGEMDALVDIHEGVKSVGGGILEWFIWMHRRDRTQKNPLHN